MRMERGQKSKASRFQGQNAPLSKMQEISKELKWNRWKRCIDRMRQAPQGSMGGGSWSICTPIYGVSVQEVPYAGEDHRHSKAVRSGNHIVIADRATGLNGGNGASFGGFFDTVGEWEEGVRSDYTCGQ
jgi:hypothetical protein